MTPQSSDDKRIRAYFSHSYRPEDKHLNLFFWQLFSDAGCYFTVDQKPYENAPMDITYVEWLMRRSDCFIAVMPKRPTPSTPDGCSPYQTFENGLAFRAKKPRLIFAQEGLPERLLQGHEDEICFFYPHRYKEQGKMFEEKAYKLVQKARAQATDTARPTKPVALLVEQLGVYNEKNNIKEITQAVKSYGFSFEHIPPASSFENDAQFAHKLEEYEVLISETRWPFIPLDIFAIAHQRCIPIIRICHLDSEERKDQVARMMSLAYREDEWLDDTTGKLARLLKRYRIDDGMSPVIFWNNIKYLTSEITSRLQRMSQSRDELLTLSDAKRYFLSRGRQPIKVFISNSHEQNELGSELADRLYEEGVKTFQYKKKDAIEMGTDDWLEKGVYKEIDNSGVFVALLNKAYLEGPRPWCTKELARASDLSRQNKLKIFAYVIEDIPWPEEYLGRMQGRYLIYDPSASWVSSIVEDIVKYLDRPTEGPVIPPQEITKDVNIVYYEESGELGTFEAVENAQIVRKSTTPYQLKTRLINEFRKAGANYPGWENVVTIIGEELGNEIFAQPLIGKAYHDTLNAANFQKRLVRLRFASDRAGFDIPFEWIQTRNGSLPLCLEHPIQRFLAGCPRSRPTISSHEKNDLRILLAALDISSDLSKADNEIDEIGEFLVEKAGLPESNICKLHSNAATFENLGEEIQGGNYQLLHLAGRGYWEEGKGACFQVFSNSTKKDIAEISAPVLKEWISKSNLRFAYLSNSLSGEARHSYSDTKPGFRPTQSMIQAVVEAQVPEVIGFPWLVPGEDSCQLALAFYEGYVAHFDASVALYEARKKFADRNARIWASPVLVQQFQE